MPPKKPPPKKPQHPQPQPPPKPTTKTLHLRLCKSSFQSTGLPSFSPPATFNIDEFPDLKTKEGWEIFEKAICLEFSINHWAHRPGIHHPAMCSACIDANQLLDKKFDFEGKVYLVHFERREEWMDIEEDDEDWYADPARDFLAEFDREMEEKLKEQRGMDEGDREDKGAQ